MVYTRRELGKMALATIPAAGLWPASLDALTRTLQKPNSKWAGVQVGMNVPYNFGTGNYTTGDEIFDRCVKLGVSGVELRAQPVELFLGSPAAIAGAAAQAARAGGAGGRRPRGRCRRAGGRRRGAGGARRRPRRRPGGRDAGAASRAEGGGRRDAEMASGRLDEQGQGVPQEVRRRRRLDRDRQVGRHLRLRGRRSRLRVRAVEGARRARAVDRDFSRRHRSASASSPTSTR